jgi:hypothetical protein
MPALAAAALDLIAGAQQVSWHAAIESRAFGGVAGAGLGANWEFRNNHGVVKDPSGAVVPDATVQISNPVSAYARTTTTAADGTFKFTNVPFNPYHMTVSVGKFAPYTQDVEIRSSLPVSVEADLKIGAASTTVAVTKVDNVV